MKNKAKTNPISKQLLSPELSGEKKPDIKNVLSVNFLPILGKNLSDFI